MRHMTLNAGAVIWDQPKPGTKIRVIGSLIRACDGGRAVLSADFDESHALDLVEGKYPVTLPDCPACAVMLDQLLSERPR